MDAVAGPRDTAGRTIEPGAETGLRAIVSAEGGFDVTQFLEGAQSAYRMILEAFWKGDRAALGWLTEADVANAFVEAIDARAAAGHTLEHRLVPIERGMINNPPPPT